jgi:predicted nuclease with TOPRIM domain
MSEPDDTPTRLQRIAENLATDYYIGTFKHTDDIHFLLVEVTHLREQRDGQLACVERARQHELIGPVAECACSSCDLHHRLGAEVSRLREALQKEGLRADAFFHGREMAQCEAIDLRQKLEGVQEEREEMRQSITVLSADLETTQAHHARAEADVSSLREELQEARQEGERHEQRIEDCNSYWRVQREAAEADVSRLREDCEARIKERNHLHEQSARDATSIANWSNRAIKAEAEVSRLQQENAALKADIQQIIDDREVNNESMAAHIRELEDELKNT